ncbi:MAG: alpha-amylase family glycosyl hydrolase [Gaiellaceae bacterium]
MWWQEAVVYQIYPRSFQDSDGDGVGDLRGITQRLDHLSYLGVDALWLSPIYPSPLADFGYDVSDFTAVDPQFGTMGDFDELVAAAHERGLRVLLDLVACHTSIEHPWFREHPDRYIWSPVDGPPNNWVAAFGGPAWNRDEESGRWYLHSFYPEQPDLNWRNPEVVAAMQDVVRFWLGRGVDGFRLDAIDRLVKDDQLRDDPPASTPFPLPLDPQAARLEMRYSGNRPEAIQALRALREAAGDALLVGELYRPVGEYEQWLEVLDLVFAFEFLFSPWDAERLRAAIEPAAALRRAAWVMSNHDFDRLASRVGPENLRAAAVLLLTLPGTAFVYQGDELGLANGPGHEPPFDRAGRDRLRHPMQWAADGGFTTGRPWLPLVDPEARNVADERPDASSLLSLYRQLLELRRGLGRGFRLLDAEPGVVAYERDGHVVAVNTTAESRTAPEGERMLATHIGDDLPPHAALIVRN